MPVYNGGNYFRKALESALAQDYPSVEIVVVNDGSTDGGVTESIALGYRDRIKYFSQQNKGVAGALNMAIQQATGDYFAWLSHDDIHLSYKTTAQIRFLEALGKPDACLFSDYDLIDSEDRRITTVRLPKERIRQAPRVPLLNGLINGCTLLIPMSIMRSFGPFDERLRYTQDYDLWNKILGEHEFFHQPEVLIQYRVHPEQDTQKQKVAPEADPLWIRMMADRSAAQRGQLYGSSYQFFKQIGEFLKHTPMLEASDYAIARSDKSLSETLVSVVIPFWNEVGLVHRALESVTNQVGVRVEIILVDDGSSEDISSIEKIVRADSRIRLIRQTNQGAAAARNRAMLSARGEYIAFLDADDSFMPNKIQRQLQLMQENAVLFSHTSYYVSYPGVQRGLGLRRSGGFTGACYPSVISSCPIAVPTVMLHRSIIDEGFIFPVEAQIGEDLLAWIDLAAKYLLLGIDEPLSIVEWSATSAALSPVKQVTGLSTAIAALERHPLHSRHKAQIDLLRAALKELLGVVDCGRTDDSSEKFAARLIDQTWGINSAVPVAAFGRAPLLQLEKL